MKCIPNKLSDHNDNQKNIFNSINVSQQMAQLVCETFIRHQVAQLTHKIITLMPRVYRNVNGTNLSTVELLM